MAKNDNLNDYLADLYLGIRSKNPNASKNPQDFRSEIENISTADSIPEWDGSLTKIITFAIDDTEYQAVDGMTWAEWVESDYNTDEYKIDVNAATYPNKVYRGNLNLGGTAYFITTIDSSDVTTDGVAPDDVIVADYTYWHATVIHDDPNKDV